MEVPQGPPLTDSPWFWVLVFSLMALGALVAMGPKYSRRQTAIERNYQARERIAERIGTNGGANKSRESDAPVERRELATAENRLIPLWPLAVILIVVAVFSAIMLYRGRGRPGTPGEESAAP